MSKQVHAMDEMLQRTLVNFMRAQIQAYIESIHTMPGDNPHVCLVQAKYEAYSLAFAALAFSFNDMDPNKTGKRDKLPEEWQEVMSTIHDQICKTGDDYLRKQGINPDDLV